MWIACGSHVELVDAKLKCFKLRVIFNKKATNVAWLSNSKVEAIAFVD